MVEVTIDSIRVSLMSQHRVVILKDVDSDRYLPIWIGPCEADAITVTLQEMEVSRPLTHDLLKNVIGGMGGGSAERGVGIRGRGGRGAPPGRFQGLCRIPRPGRPGGGRRRRR